MQAVILPFSESKDLQMLLDLARRFKIPFRIQEIEPENDFDDTDSDVLDNEDMEILEAMVRLESLPNNKPYSVLESKRILAELKEMD